MKRQLESSSLGGRRCQKLSGRGRDGRATSQHHHSATSVLQRRQVNDSPNTIGGERRRPILPAACTAPAHDLLGIVVSSRPRPLNSKATPLPASPEAGGGRREAGGGRRGSDPGAGVGRVQSRRAAGVWGRVPGPQPQSGSHRPFGSAARAGSGPCALALPLGGPGAQAPYRWPLEENRWPWSPPG